MGMAENMGDEDRVGCIVYIEVPWCYHSQGNVWSLVADLAGQKKGPEFPRSSIFKKVALLHCGYESEGIYLAFGRNVWLSS